MTDDATPAKVRLTDGLGSTLPRWYCIASNGVATLCADENDARTLAKDCDLDWPTNAPHRAVLLGDVAALREALKELRDRIKDHPAYAALTQAEELDVGGDTAELSYLARVADAALGD